jgi:hypothetical protein
MEIVMRVLGVQCTSSFAYLAVVDDGDVVELGPERLAPAQSTDEDRALWETLGTFRDALDEIKPDHVRLLLPGTGPNAKQTHGAWAPRVELETLLRMAAAKRDLPVERIARATVRARLGLARSGNFETAIGTVVPERGGYWVAGRLAAAAAALAGKPS